MTQAQGASAPVHLVYPERRTVSAETILLWAADAFANGELTTKPDTLEGAIAGLEDIGQITTTDEPQDKRFALNQDEDGAPAGDEALPADHDTFYCDRCGCYHAGGCP